MIVEVGREKPVAFVMCPHEKRAPVFLSQTFGLEISSKANLGGHGLAVQGCKTRRFVGVPLQWQLGCGAWSFRLLQPAAMIALM